MKDREKEIRYLMYAKSQLIKAEKKELHDLKMELQRLNDKKTRERKRRR